MKPKNFNITLSPEMIALLEKEGEIILNMVDEKGESRMKIKIKVER